MRQLQKRREKLNQVLHRVDFILEEGPSQRLTVLFAVKLRQAFPLLEVINIL